MTTRIPVDSADARELREAEESADLDPARVVDHDPACRGGWLGLDDDERPKPCPTCKPWLFRVACRGCQAPAQSCDHLALIGRGRCCQDCDHDQAGGVQ